MIVVVFVALLVLFLAGFFGIDIYAQAQGASDLLIKGTNISLLSPEIRVFLGLGILFCQVAIILFSMVDRIGDTIKETIKPLVRLLPLGAFLTAIWKTFAPIVFKLLPDGIGQSLGVASTDTSIAQMVTSERFGEGIILTLVTMVLFLLATYALGRPRETPEVQALRAELAKYKRELRRGL